MRKFLAPVFSFLCGVWICGTVFAQGPAGYEKFYDAPTDVNLGGRPVVADIALYADMEVAKTGDLRVALVTDVTKFIVETEQDLENWIATNRKKCGERWGAGKPLIAFPPGAIRFALDLELQMYNCGWNGKGEPRRYMLETGSVDVTLEPYVENGKLQARLGAFSIDNRAGVTKYVPLEYVTRRVLIAELEKLNKNPKFYRAPQPLLAEGFDYQSISAKEYEGGRVVITARYKAKGSRDALDRLAEKFREDGVTQERTKEK